MKRSEMVQIYTDILKMYGYPKDNGFMPRAKLADMMLQVAENNGMLPPEIDFTQYKQIPIGTHYHQGGSNTIFLPLPNKYTWESENV